MNQTSMKNWINFQLRIHFCKFFAFLVDLAFSEMYSYSNKELMEKEICYKTSVKDFLGLL